MAISTVHGRNNRYVIVAVFSRYKYKNERVEKKIFFQPKIDWKIAQNNSLRNEVKKKFDKKITPNSSV